MAVVGLGCEAGRGEAKAVRRTTRVVVMRRRDVRCMVRVAGDWSPVESKRGGILCDMLDDG